MYANDRVMFDVKTIREMKIKEKSSLLFKALKKFKADVLCLKRAAHSLHWGKSW